MLNIYAFTEELDEFELPDFNHAKYKDIETFKEYELSSCVAYELAIRNSDFLQTIKKQDNFRILYDEAIEKVRATKNMEHVDNLSFDGKKFDDLGFDTFAISYYMFRREGYKVDILAGLSHLELCNFCSKHEDKIENLAENIRAVVQKYNQNFHGEAFEGISCRYVKKYSDKFNYEIHEVNIYEGYFNDLVSDKKLASISNDDSNPFIKKKGLYSFTKNDHFDLSSAEYQSMDENILPTISLLYKRPPLIIVTNSKHIYVELNLNLSNEEILENVNQILEIKKSRESSSIHRNILNSSNMYFKDFVEHKKPKKIRENNLQEYYKILLYTYDTFILFDEYCAEINKKYDEGLLLIDSHQNKENTDTYDRKGQKKELLAWKKNIVNKKIIYDTIYMEVKNTDNAPLGTHIINDMLTLARTLIEEEEYKFLI